MHESEAGEAVEFVFGLGARITPPALKSFDREVEGGSCREILLPLGLYFADYATLEEVFRPPACIGHCFALPGLRAK